MFAEARSGGSHVYPIWPSYSAEEDVERTIQPVQSVQSVQQIQQQVQSVQQIQQQVQSVQQIQPQVQHIHDVAADHLRFKQLLKLLGVNVDLVNHGTSHRTFFFGILVVDYTCSPGPASHVYPSRLLKTGMMLDPAYSIRLPLPTFKPPVLPSPDTYHVLPDFTLPRAPAWYMALPALKDKPNGYPAPNHYTIPDMMGHGHPCVTTHPQYSLRMKLNVGSIFEDFTKTPGADRYAIIPLEVVKTRAPVYSLRQRLEPLKGLNVPGPGTYNVEYVNKPRSPIFTLGIKHSEFEAPVYVKEPDIQIDWE
ncbi:putative Outer dense fiber protein 3 [Hypsibius exemplaris]|uniref:Outer dense fiber protein 3 n=1 Tax=Hypsibius exemplaris TaxID=2072580 RepID=A0A1W0WPP5_HYPEX|nr:putative Outer dense fiber protein 3 [Hypsibius exemplaris]